MNAVTEAKAKVTMDDFEKRWYAQLIKLLKDDGKGHRHAAYAKCLEEFALNIIPAEDDPQFTASMDFEGGIIRISSGFLTDPTTFNQLSVLLRHELAHALMMHQVRMMKKIIDKYGEKGYTRISYSASLHQLENIIADYEISNQRYSEEDKKTVKNMWLNGRVIGGLITESTTEDGKDWKNMPIEDMYDALLKKIESLQERILYSWDLNKKHTIDVDYYDSDERKLKVDQVKLAINSANFYNKNLDKPTNFFGTITDFLNNKALYHLPIYDKVTQIGVIPAMLKASSLPKEWIDIIKSINDYFKNNEETDNLTKQDARDMINVIAKTSSTKQLDLVSKTGKVITDLITPEEKLIAIDTIKAIIPSLEEYNTWYAKVQKVLKDPKYSKDDIEAILKNLEGNK